MQVKKQGEHKAQPQQDSAQSSTLNQPIERTYRGQKFLDHDLYKLEISKALKNVSWTDEPSYVDLEHIHFFHTIDSDGKSHQNSTAIAGHFHRMRIIPQGEGKPPLVECASGPLRLVKRLIRGRLKIVEEPVNGDDSHMHQVTYLRSDRVEVRKVHPLAVQAQAQEAQKTAPVPGVQG